MNPPAKEDTRDPDPAASPGRASARGTGGGSGRGSERAIRGALLRFRVIAYVVGVGLITLVLIGVPLKYLADTPVVAETVGPLHGFLFMVYLVLTVDLSSRCRLGAVPTLLVMLAGTIPFLSFVAERKVTHQVTRQMADREGLLRSE